MTARILDGAAAARTLRAEVARDVETYRRTSGRAPRLAAVLVGEDPASQVYVRNKIAACREVGIGSDEIRLPAEASRAALLERLASLNANQDVDGILVQLPLPRGFDRFEAILALDPAKDVDGLHPLNTGRLSMKLDAPIPCTPQGVLELLDRNGLAIAGRHAVVVGRSDIVGRPLSLLLTRRDATVTVCHSRTPDLPSYTRRADLLVAAVGRPAFLCAEHIAEGAIVVDVGINRIDDVRQAASLFGDDSPRVAQVRERGSTLVGDVHPRDGAARAGWLTPVPGGIGPLTIACLLKNTLRAARLRRPGGA